MCNPVMLLFFCVSADRLPPSVSVQPQGIGEPSVYHAVVVIFLEFFAWGLLTTPMLTVGLVTPTPSSRRRAVM